MKTKFFTITVGLLMWVRLISAQAPAPIINKVIEIRPSAPSATWPIELPPKATATVTVNVDLTGSANGAKYEIKSGPTPSITSSAGSTVVWTKNSGSPGDSSFVFNVVNTATVANASTTARVECVWKPKRGTGPGGGGGGGGSGGGTTPPDIHGLATAIASLPVTGSCAWSLDRMTQLADGSSVITYRVTLVNAQGAPLTTPFTKIEAVNLAPATAAWSISPTSGSSPLVGTVKSSTSSKGTLQATYTEPGTSVVKTCQSGIQIVFWNLKHVVKQLAKTDQSPARVKLGLSEEVDLSLEPSGGVVGKWSISSGKGTLSSNTGATSTFTAPPTAQDVATRVDVDGKLKNVTFKVVAPANVVATGTVTYTRREHTAVEYDCDALIEVEFLPTDVSFYKVRCSEQAGTTTEDGDWLIAPWHPAVAHLGYALKYIPANNTTTDNIRSEAAGKAPQMAWPNGSYIWHIPMDYQADGGGLVANWKSFDQVITTTPVTGGECKVEITKFGPKGKASNY